MKENGIFTISIDLELAWGVCDKPLTPKLRREIQQERYIVKKILSLFYKYNFQATWGIVAHLLLNRCDYENDLVHPEFKRPMAYSFKQDWFFQHPVDQDDSFWYGSDLIDSVIKALPKQEIASHSFCHIPYRESITSREAIDTDISLAKSIHTHHGLPFDIFIFPRNMVGYKDLLAKQGIRAYRGKTIKWYERILHPYICRLLNLVYFIFGFTPKVADATIDETGMVNIPESMLFLSRKGIRKFVYPSTLIRMARKGLKRSVSSGGIFHLWFHPSNFVYNTEKHLNALEEILKYAIQLREDGKLDILTMNDILQRVEKDKLS